MNLVGDETLLPKVSMGICGPKQIMKQTARSSIGEGGSLSWKVAMAKIKDIEIPRLRVAMGMLRELGKR